MILSKAEKSFLKGEKVTSTGYSSVLSSRIREKALNALEDVLLICKHKDALYPKTKENRLEFQKKISGLCQGL